MDEGIIGEHGKTRYIYSWQCRAAREHETRQCLENCELLATRRLVRMFEFTNAYRNIHQEENTGNMQNKVHSLGDPEMTR